MNYRQSKVSGLVFGGIMAALVVLFALVPFLGVLMPIPLVLAYVRYGGRVAGLSALISSVLCLMVQGPAVALGFMIPGGIMPGLMFGYGFRHRLKPVTTWLLAVAVFFLSFGVQYMIQRALVFGGQDPIVAVVESELGQQQMKATTQLMEPMLQQLANGSPQEQQAAEQMRARIQEYQANPAATVWVLLPSILFLVGAGSAAFNQFMCRLVLPRLGHEVPPSTPFGELKLPAWVSVAYFIIFALSASTGVLTSGTVLNVPWFVQVLMNLFQPLALVMAFAGVAIAYGFLIRKSISKPFAIAIIVLVTMVMQLQLFVILALMDPIMDFRGLGHGWLQNPDNQS